MLYQVKRRYDRATSKEVAALFENLGLPAPKKTLSSKKVNDYIATSDGGYLIFINKAACVLRFTSDHVKRFDHPRVLQPLFSKQCGMLEANIYPGVSSPANTLQMKFLKARLKLSRIDYWDYQEVNCGLLPQNGGPVVIDMGALRILRERTKEVGKLLTVPNKDHQKEIYGDLREVFHKAWPENAQSPYHDLMNDAWEKCAEMKSEGILVSSWLDAPHTEDNKNARHISESYQKTCDKYNNSGSFRRLSFGRN